LVVCLGFSAPALAQTYDALPVPAGITIDSTPCRAVGGQAEIDGTMQQIVGRSCLQPGERITQAGQRFSRAAVSRWRCRRQADGKNVL
jgi:hypothetical protein